MRRIHVLGGHSTVGRHLVSTLEASGQDVRVFSRRDGVDVTRPETLEPAVADADTVVSLVGASLSPLPLSPEQTFESVDRDGNLALLEAAQTAGVRRFVYLSVFGDYPPDVAYVTAHRVVEDAMKTSPLSTTAVRPTGFFESFDVLRGPARVGLAGRIGSGDARTNPIGEADLAAVIATHVAEGPETVECGGPEILTRREISRRLGARVQLPVPAFALRMNEAALRPVNRRLADLVRFLRHVLTHDGIAPAHGSQTLR